MAPVRQNQKPASAKAPRLSLWLDHAAQRPLLLSSVLGVITALGLPPFHLIPAIIGMAGWLWLLMHAQSRRHAFLMSWTFGFGYFVAGLYWIAIAFYTDADKFGALAVPAILLLSAVMAIFPGMAGVMFGLVRPRHPIAAALTLALAWTAAEWLRAHFLWGFPWNLIGYAWVGLLPVSQTAAWIGIYGLSTITVLVGALFITVVADRGRARWIGPSLAMTIVLLLMIGGSLRLWHGDVGHQPEIRLRLVQANIAQHHKWDPDLRAESFHRHLEQTTTPADSPISHVIWPETASAYILEEDVAARNMIGNVTPLEGLLITGFNRFDFHSEPKRGWNSLGVLNGSGDIVSVYDKHRLVPFGEFLPWRPLLASIGLEKITKGSIDFYPGVGSTTLTVDGLPPFSPLICYEAIFTGDVVDPDDRPAWLLNVTNDAWFGRSSGPYQHFAMARMRAIEQGLPLVRSANTGISAIVDPYGRIEAVLGLGRAGVLDAPLPRPLAQPTLYAKRGQDPVLLMVVIFISIIFLIEKFSQNRYLKFR